MFISALPTVDAWPIVESIIRPSNGGVNRRAPAGRVPDDRLTGIRGPGRGQDRERRNRTDPASGRARRTARPGGDGGKRRNEHAARLDAALDNIRDVVLEIAGMDRETASGEDEIRSLREELAAAKADAEKARADNKRIQKMLGQMAAHLD